MKAELLLKHSEQRRQVAKICGGDRVAKNGAERIISEGLVQEVQQGGTDVLTALQSVDIPTPRIKPCG